MSEDFELLGRLLLAAVLGGAIGAERELNDQAAGLRTHMLLTIGACLFTLVSAYGFGGGAIVRQGLTVKGLTTAASIWATASVGVAIGAGSYVLGIGGTLLVVGTLFGLRRLSNLLQRWGVSREEYVLSTTTEFDAQRVVDAIRSERVDLRSLERREGDEEDQIVLVVKLRPLYRPEQLIDVLGSLDGVRYVEWEH